VSAECESCVQQPGVMQVADLPTQRITRLCLDCFELWAEIAEAVEDGTA